MIRLEDGNLRALLPPHLAEDSRMAASAAALEPHLRTLARSIPNLLLYGRLCGQPAKTMLPPLHHLTEARGDLKPLSEAELELLAWQFHVDFRETAATTEQLAAMVRQSIPWHRIKGTPASLKAALALFGISASIEEDGRHWAEYQLGLGEADDLDTVATAVRVAAEMAPVRCHLFRVYNEHFDMRPIVLSDGPILGDGWLSYYSGVPVSGDDGNDDVLASLGATRRVQAESYLASDTDASFGTASGIGNLAPYDDRFVLGRSGLSDKVTRNNPFVVGALVSFLWAERQTVARSWNGEWDKRRWSDVTGFDRKLPRWLMPCRDISRSQLVSAESELSDTNSRLGGAFAVVIDNPGRLGGFALSEHDCGRRELRLHELIIVSSGMEMPAAEPQNPQTASDAWLASALPIPNPTRVQEVLHSELAIKLKSMTWESPETAGTAELSSRSEALEPENPRTAGVCLLSSVSETLENIVPEQAVQQDGALLLAVTTWESPETAGTAELSSRSEALVPPDPAASIISYQAPLWLGTWAANRSWNTSPQLSIQ